MKNICFQMSRKVFAAALLTLFFAFPALAQKITVSGTVIDQTGEPLIGASVIVKGETMGVATNFDGEYSLSVNPDATLVFSYVGYDTQEIAVDGRTQINVTMKENSVVLGEVVAIGYGTVKKSDATGAVATVKPSEIEAGLATSAQDLLVGASPGVVVTTSGNPSEGGNIQIRGGASLAASNDPLIVIDGVPMDTKGVVGSSNPLALVSPENVESMTILKGASATAIYGSRASNGVIIITTKTGKKGRPQVNFTVNAYINTPRKYVNMMSADEFRAFIKNEYGENSNQASALGSYNTDWQKAATRTTLSTDYSLSVGGTVGVLPYRVAIAYTDNNGILNKTGMDRLTGSINLSPKFFKDLLSVNANVKGAYLRNQYAANGMSGGASMNPTIPVRDFENGTPDFGYWTSYDGSGRVTGPDTKGTEINSTTAPINPISLVEGATSKGTAYQSVGNLQLDLKMPFLTDLRANLNLGYDYQHGENTNWKHRFTPDAWTGGYTVLDDAGKPFVIRDGGVSRNYEYQTKVNLLLDFYLNYMKEFESINSSVNITAGYSWQKFHNKKRNYSTVYEVGDPDNEKYLGVQAYPTTRDIYPHQLVSFFGRADLAFLNRYLLTVTVRRDGTSRFSKDHRWGTFPAVALGWKILEEKFMEPARDVLNELKLRADYGITGQQDLGDDLFPYLPIYNGSTNISGVYPGITGTGSNFPLTPGAYNADLKWEETHTWNIGLDFGFLNNRILGSFDFYKRKTKDLLTFANYPAGSNLTNKGNINLGDLENTGIEFTLTARPIVKKDFTWTSILNLGWNKNKITRLADGADTQDGYIGTAGMIQKHEVGYPAFSFYVYEQVYDDNGDPLEGVFVDRDGDGQITEADKYLYHSRSPKVTFTWNNTFNWRNWDFGIVLRANIGNYMYNGTQAGNVFKSSNSALPLSNMMADTFLFESSDNTKLKSDYFVQNASFLRCDNISVGYTWDNLIDNALRLRLYGAVQNPFVITKYKGLDPEVFSGIDRDIYPKPVTFTLGLVATF